MKESEFIASQKLTVHVKDNKSVSSFVEGNEELIIEQGKPIPEIFIHNFILCNPDFIANLPKKEGIPQLTKEQSEKYNIDFVKIISEKKAKEPKTEKEVIDRLNPEYDEANLTEKLANLGAVKFKQWAEETFGKEKIDKSKPAEKIIIKILKLQDKGEL